MAKKIKVAGYSQKTSFDGNIEYRDFSPDLVGLQLASDGGTPLFTMGNFAITTNLDPKLDKTYITGKFSEFFSLDKLDLTVEESVKLLENNASVFLNLDRTHLKNYALFGSMVEYFRVTLEEIILKWPASLYVTPTTFFDSQELISFTFENYNYDFISNEATFKVNTTFLNNKFRINYLTTGTVVDSFNQENDLRNLTVNYGSYAILINGVEYDILNFTGSTFETSDYIYLKVKGDVFSGGTNGQYLYYHIKPKKTIENKFFNSLTGLHEYLLNRQNFPIYTATFNYPVRNQAGIIMYTSKSVTWPVSDGYNIDFDTSDYLTYATDIFDLATNYDLNETGLMTRFLVSESISAFDTVPVRLAEVHEDTTTGQKVNKTLNLYGRSFDDINQFIEGIAFAHTVTYDKQDNVPDVYLKDLARVLGWELISSVIENDILSNFINNAPSQFAGQPVGLTQAQADIELWRRLILNSPWVWKSKGARKSIEFLLNFIGTPLGLVTFNEYIYRAKAPIDVDIFLEALEQNNLTADLSLYPVDSDGYPRPLPDTPDMYFQNYGLWYRETGGTGATIDITSGNNPHAGPYDGGSKYINQFRSLIPNFSAVTIVLDSDVTSERPLFLNYKLGEITNYDGDTYVDVVNNDGSDLSNCIVYDVDIVKDPMPQDILTQCGCPCEGDDEVLSVCVETKEVRPAKPCETLAKPPSLDQETGLYVFAVYNYDTNGNEINASQTAYIDKECCNAIGGKSAYADSVYQGAIPSNPRLVSSGFVCCSIGEKENRSKCGCLVTCNWTIEREPIYIPQGSQNAFLNFKTLYGSGTNRVVVPDATGCPIVNGITAVPNIIDPYTGEVGIGCQVSDNFIQAPYEYEELYTYYQLKGKNANGGFVILNGGKTEISCCEFTYELYIKYAEAVGLSDGGSVAA